MRVGLLTGGGDVPGLNAAIRAVVKRGEGEYGHSIIGFRNGWRGVVDGFSVPLTRQHIRNVLPVGGTLLGTARYHPHAADGGLDAVLSTLEAERIEALICIGGDGTLHAASKVAEAGVRIVAIPKTIDNDVWGTDQSIGFDTAVSIATEAIDRIHTTAESHNRVMIVEVMGRHAGWIAATSGIAGGAEIVLAPEEPFDIDKIERFLKHRHRAHASFSIVVVAEGAVPAPGTLDALRDADGQVRRDRRRRHRRAAQGRDREAHGLRHPGHRARPRAARRHPRRTSTGSSARGSASPRSTPSARGQSDVMTALRGETRRDGAAQRGRREGQVRARRAAGGRARARLIRL